MSSLCLGEQPEGWWIPSPAVPSLGAVGLCLVGEGTALPAPGSPLASHFFSLPEWLLLLLTVNSGNGWKPRPELKQSCWSNWQPWLAPLLLAAGLPSCGVDSQCPCMHLSVKGVLGTWASQNDACCRTGKRKTTWHPACKTCRCGWELWDGRNMISRWSGVPLLALSSENWVLPVYFELKLWFMSKNNLICREVWMLARTTWSAEGLWC